MATSTDDIQPINERIESAQHQLKLVLLGESAVGKTSFLHRFVKDDFTDKREPTVGAGFLTKTTRLDDRLIKLNCWDTAGQERFHSLAPMYYRGAQAAIVMYDVTKQSTFEKAKTWIRELQRQAPPHIVIALVGNKIDLCDSIPPTQQHNDDSQVDGENLDFPENEERQDRQVSKEEASLYAAESALLFYETSARLNLNVDKVFIEIAQNVPAEYLTPVRQPGGNKGSTSLLTSNTGNKVDLSNGGSGSRQPGAGCAC